jgi:hypothetical protein
MGLRSAARRLWVSRTWRSILIAVSFVIVLFVAATVRLIMWPAVGMPARVDAIVMLAGPGDRLPLALQLAREHRAPVLVVSLGQHGYGSPCPPPTPAVKLICFEPNPGDTRGEAEYVGHLANQYHWRSLVLVIAQEQDTRARIRMRRCFGGSIYAITAPVSWEHWPFQIAYEWGALFKAEILQRSC